MFKFLLSLFSKKEKVILNDADFGKIVFIDNKLLSTEPYWEMLEPWDMPEYNACIQCVEIPGNLNGPSDYARDFLISKRNNLKNIWNMFEGELNKQVEVWFPDIDNKCINDIFILTSLNLDSKGEWEVCFESKSGLGFVCLAYQLVGNNIISGTVNT